MNYAFAPTSSSATPGQTLMRARQPLALHDLLHREHRGDVQRHAGVVPFAVSGRAVDDRIVIADARLLRRLRNAVDVRADGDHRLADPHVATHAVGMPAIPL